MHKFLIKKKTITFTTMVTNFSRPFNSSILFSALNNIQSIDGDKIVKQTNVKTTFSHKWTMMEKDESNSLQVVDFFFLFVDGEYKICTTNGLYLNIISFFDVIHYVDLLRCFIFLPKISIEIIVKQMILIRYNFWHSIWSLNGKQQSGHIAGILKHVSTAIQTV